MEQMNRVIHVKVHWRKNCTYHFPIRMFQSIQIIYEYFSKLEGIDVSHISLKLRKKYLQPTDTPYSINYNTSDSIDGNIEYYKSPYLLQIKCEEQPEDDATFRIIQQDIRYPIFMSIKKTDQMIILYIKISEKLGLDIDSFTLKFDGDKIKHSDTMESLDLDGDECFELFKKNT